MLIGRLLVLIFLSVSITTALTGNQGGKPFVMEFERMK